MFSIGDLPHVGSGEIKIEQNETERKAFDEEEKMFEAIGLTKKNSLADKVPSPRDIIEKLKNDMKEKKRLSKKSGL